jgi:hypothetical protein
MDALDALCFSEVGGACTACTACTACVGFLGPTTKPQ